MMTNTMRPHRAHFGVLLRSLLVMLLLPATLQAQKLKERLADRAAEQFDYPHMAAIYEDLLMSGKADPSDMRRLALAYRKMGQPLKAEATYLKLMGTGGQTPDDVFAYAEQLRANGKYPEALEWYGAYAALRPEDMRAQAYVNNPRIFERLMRDLKSTGDGKKDNKELEKKAGKLIDKFTSVHLGNNKRLKLKFNGLKQPPFLVFEWKM